MKKSLYTFEHCGWVFASCQQSFIASENILKCNNNKNDVWIKNN